MIATFNEFISNYSDVIVWVGASLIVLAFIYALIEAIKPVVDFFKNL